jgi:hypothetical protein
MRDQLKLPRGVGLVVDAVEPKSAADVAGLRAFDVLQKWDDQWLVNPAQLAALERGQKGGDEVALTIVRQGARQTVKAKLIEQEVDPMTLGVAGGNVNFFTVPLPPPGGNANVVAARANDLALEGDVMLRQLDGRQNTRWADDAVTISLAREGGKTTAVTIMDKPTDKLIYTGGPEGLDALYKDKPDLRAKVAQAENAAVAPVRIEFNRARLLATPGAPAEVVTAPAGAGGNFVFIREGGAGMTAVAGALPADARGKVLRWQDDEHLLFIRATGNRPTYLLALSRKDGRTVFDGPVMTDEQRQAVPADVAEPLELISKRPELMQEFGAPPADRKPADKGK